MKRLKNSYHTIKTYLKQFSKRPKKKKQPKLQIVNKRTVNLAVASGLAFLVLVGVMGGIRAITLSGKITALKQELSKVATNQPKEKSATTIDNHLQYYLNDFVYWYFTIPKDNDEQTKQADKLKEFYGTEPDIQAQGQRKNPSQLDWSRLLSVKDNVATYEVHYKQTVKTNDKEEEKEFATAFNIPYQQTKTGYYIAGLPWFSSLTSSQSKTTAQVLKLNQSDNLSDKERKKLDNFLKVFFTNYTSNQDNLDLMADNISTVEQMTFETLDYSYYYQTKDSIIAYVQVTFDNSGTSHPENFTLTLNEKGNTYTVQRLEHTIQPTYANHTKN
ncbi:conjugal transfer protein [Streptococcus canis]|uniref:conjugal transfer protein n=1 Tax=Streptococcus canis TaxID=1329 RepID=UPI0029922284|nr:conjugal transfer protein [Streptococcus canis]